MLVEVFFKRTIMLYVSGRLNDRQENPESLS